MSFEEHIWNFSVLQRVHISKFVRVPEMLILNLGPDIVCCDTFCELSQFHEKNVGTVAYLQQATTVFFHVFASIRSKALLVSNHCNVKSYRDEG
jgi:hypothetical protein